MPLQPVPSAPAKPADAATLAAALELLDHGTSPGRTAQRIRVTIAELRRLLRPVGVRVVGPHGAMRYVTSPEVDFAVYARLKRREALTTIAAELDCPIEHVQWLAQLDVAAVAGGVR